MEKIGIYGEPRLHGALILIGCSSFSTPVHENKKPKRSKKKNGTFFYLKSNSRSIPRLK
jgi:hypothetical protein